MQTVDRMFLIGSLAVLVWLGGVALAAPGGGKCKSQVANEWIPSCQSPGADCAFNGKCQVRPAWTTAPTDVQEWEFKNGNWQKVPNAPLRPAAQTEVIHCMCLIQIEGLEDLWLDDGCCDIVIWRDTTNNDIRGVGTIGACDDSLVECPDGDCIVSGTLAQGRPECD